MAFSLSPNVYILVAQWRTLTDKGISGSFVAVFALAVFAECFRSYNIYRKSISPRWKAAWENRLRSLLIETVLYTVQIVLLYLLMLVAMTYNVWLFIAVVLGSGTGYFMCVPLLNRYIVMHNIPLETGERYEPITAT
ncbi:high affinity copper uptake protein 1 [Nematostella vectensis]|uniref:high affinity copper uptake protein 1 n=1 Tax=Nematostella vectensis TaxID=45351 RepID=UPI00138FFB03|nr:high affinity copper uptake protein 1 [Nematostella vectensis]XP_032241962.1 high affinity copper uptake protein 1 [Nematostella vectensis]